MYFPLSAKNLPSPVGARTARWCLVNFIRSNTFLPFSRRLYGLRVSQTPQQRCFKGDKCGAREYEKLLNK